MQILTSCSALAHDGFLWIRMTTWKLLFLSFFFGINFLIALSYGPLFQECPHLEALPNTKIYYVSWEQYIILNIYQQLRVEFF